MVRAPDRSREFIEFLKLLDAACPVHTAIKLILDNHSAHISRETRARRYLTLMACRGDIAFLLAQRHCALSAIP